jgi:glycosyltransferase involved in cell wall biosynthesis
MLLKKISVIVATYSEGRLKNVLNCIKSLKTQTFSPKEIILALDQKQELIEFYETCLSSEVKIVASEGYGLSHARNAGVKNAECEIVAFIDDDATADEHWLENLVKNFDVVGVGGRVEPVWNEGRPKFFPEELNWIVGCSYVGLPQLKASIRNPIGCNMSFRKDIFQRVGYFRDSIGRRAENLISGEETDFSIRVLEKYLESRIVYDPSAVVYHQVPRNRTTLKYLVRRSFYEGFSIALIVESIRPKAMKIMSVENDYLKYLLRISIPLRLKKAHRLENLQQSFVLATSMFSVMVGYLLGRLSGQI